MSEQDESVPVEPVNPAETPAPAERRVENTMACQINVEQNALIQNSMAGAIIAGQSAAADNSVAGAVVAGGSIEFNNSAAMVSVVGGTAQIANSSTGVLFAPASTVEHSRIGVLIAPQAALGKDVKVIMTTQQALLFGAAFGMVAAVLGRYLRRRRSRRG